jgi:hypothetical protein
MRMGIEFRRPHEVLTKDNLLGRISDLDIFHHYCGPFKKVGDKFSSELRDDPVPSAVVGYHNGRFRYRDFGEPRHTFDSFDYVAFKYGLSFSETLKKISEDLHSGLVAGTSQFPLLTKRRVTIQIKKRGWRLKDVEYWKQYHISGSTLHIFKVSPLSHWWIGLTRYHERILTYAYLEHYPKIKVYCPLEKDRKWMGNVGWKQVQGMTVLPEQGGTVVLTSSLKDVMVLYEMGIPAIALQSESMMPHPKLIKHLRGRFDEIVVLYDNDMKTPNPGQEMAGKIVEEYGLRNVCLPDMYRSKDPSDIVKTVGFQEASDVIKKLI